MTEELNHIVEPLRSLAIEVSGLSLDPSNARKHDDKNLQAIKDSLTVFGQRKPIVVQKTDKGLIVRAGNGTVEAARSMGWSHLAATVLEEDNVTATAFAIADNRTSDLSEFDDDILAEQLKGLRDDDFNLDELGFDQSEVDELLKGIELPDPDKEAIEDDVPEIEQNIHGVKRGDIWKIGNHRIMCGDSTSKEDVDALMDGQKADMVYTDPPYGINEVCDRVEHVKTFKKQGVAKKGQYSQIAGDDSIDVAMSAIEVARSLGSSVNIFWGGNYYDLEPSSCWIVWDKRVEEKQSDLNSDCELAYVDHKHKASVRIFRHLWKGMIKQSEQGQARVHPTQKPIALAEWCFENYGDPKTVLDLFLGSGSTLIACEKTARKCYGLEIDPHYCSVIIQRWQDYSGKKAERIECQEENSRQASIS